MTSFPAKVYSIFLSNLCTHNNDGFAETASQERITHVSVSGFHCVNYSQAEAEADVEDLNPLCIRYVSHREVLDRCPWQILIPKRAEKL